VEPLTAAVVFHFTPKSCSWLNAIKTLFFRLTRRRLKRGVFCSIVDLQAAINRFLAETNADRPNPSCGPRTPMREDTLLGVSQSISAV
jgi:hypothetical protein